MKLGDGTWRHLTGNQIGAIIAYFLIADPAGPQLSGELITTVATSRVLRSIGSLRSGVICGPLRFGTKGIQCRLDSRSRAPWEGPSLFPCDF